LAQRLAKALSLPVICKDTIKESLVGEGDTFDVPNSRKRGIESIRVLYSLLEDQLKAGTGCITESNFKKEWDRERLVDLIGRYGAICVEIQCFASAEVLEKRYRARYEEGRRHPIHCDADRFEGMASEFKQEVLEPLDLGGQYYEVNTEEFGDLEFDSLLERLGSH